MDNLQISHNNLPKPDKIRDWLVSYLANILEIRIDKISATTNFDRYGLDSVAAVNLSGDLAEWLGCELDPALVYYYPTIESIVQFLTEEKTI
jgi:acyl carrier protein